MSKQYSNEFKKSAVEKFLSPKSLNATKTAQNLGIPKSTLYGWCVKYATPVSMKKPQSISKMSREEKLQILIKTSVMSEPELGAFLRETGLHSSDLSFIKEDILNGSTGPKKPVIDPEVVKLRKDIARTTKDLLRKDRALAEMSARIVLLKKSHEIWGEPEEDE